MLSVTYNYSENGGTAATKTAYSLMKNSAVDLTPTATKAGWEFVGWNTSKDATAALASLNIGTENITLYAIYKKTFTGTFIDYNGITKQTRTVPVTIYNKATSGSLTAPTQSTYTNWSSIGWSTATAANAAVTVNGGGPAVLLLIPPSMACISAH
ncbi:MAG: InlB B-repeat-containing protein [Oscillospiraceae bacterium]|nr:InlB B-repeat-containing protein [Oscillospiraceae bacterium]